MPGRSDDHDERSLFQYRLGKIPAAHIHGPAHRHGRGRNPRRTGAADRPRRHHRAHREGGAVQKRRPGKGRDGGQDRSQPQTPDRRVRNHRRKNLRRVFQAPGQSEAGGGNSVCRRSGPCRADHRQGRRSHQAAVLSAPRLRRQLLPELGDRLCDRSGDRTAECRLPPAQSPQPLRDRHQRHGALRSQAHLHSERRARREAADHVHRRHPSARLRRRHHAPPRRRAVAGRDHARRAGSGRQRASPTTSWCRPTPR